VTHGPPDVDVASAAESAMNSRKNRPSISRCAVGRWH